MVLDTSAILLCFGAFTAVTMLILAIGSLFLDQRSRIDDRLAPLQKVFSDGDAAKSPLLHRDGRLPSSTSSSGQKADKLDFRVRLQTQLMHAGIYAPWALNALFLTLTVMMTAPLVAGTAFGGWYWGTTQHGVALGTTIAAVGTLLPFLWLRMLKRRRHTILMRSLPDFLDLMVACLESGISVDAALLRVIDELQVAHPLLAGELQVVKAQVELGAIPDAAIRTFADRADFDALRSLSTVLQQARRFGTGLAEALRTHADELRIQREQAAEERAQRASVEILVPTMLLIFPAIFVVLAGPAAIQLAEVFAKPDTTSSIPAHR